MSLMTYGYQSCDTENLLQHDDGSNTDYSYYYTRYSLKQTHCLYTEYWRRCGHQRKVIIHISHHLG